MFNLQARVTQPIKYRLRNGWLLIGPPPPSSSVIVALIINMLEGEAAHDLNDCLIDWSSSIFLHFNMLEGEASHVTVCLSACQSVCLGGF